MTGRSINSKQITVSNETHSLLFIVEGMLQVSKGERVGIDETIKILISNYDKSLTERLEVKQ